MIHTNRPSLSAYYFPLTLVASIFLGGLMGLWLGPLTSHLKPIGDIFLNVLLSLIMPLIFFSVSSAIAKSTSLKKLGVIILTMLIVFLFTGISAAFFMLMIIKIFPLNSINLSASISHHIIATDLTVHLGSILTVSDFLTLLSHNHVLALIIFSILVGISTLNTGEKGKIFSRWLQAGETIFMRIFDMVMYFAPIGFFCYFAALISDLGPQLLQNYAQVTAIYYISALFYFIFAFSGYAYLSHKVEGVKLFWKNIFLPATTAVATCSSVASIPANLEATQAMRVSRGIYETTIPLGAIIHKDGSVMGGMIKIAFLFSIFHLSFSGVSILLTAVVVSLLVGMVMGAIPGGGMLGELLILNAYGFPSSALFMIAAISIIIDPPATLLNVTGDSAASMLIARLVDGKKWSRSKQSQLLKG